MATINFTDFEGQTRTVDAAAGVRRRGREVEAGDRRLGASQARRRPEQELLVQIRDLLEQQKQTPKL